MGKRLLPTPTRWIVSPPDNRKLVVVGCGGTGSYVAEGLCRLFIDKPERDIILVDFDTVEERNCRRQNFYAEEAGKYKCEALAVRLARKYGREIGWAPVPFSSDMGLSMGYQMSHPLSNDVIIGCVDESSGGRAAIAEAFESYAPGWWLDAGNSEHSGQVLLGNTAGNHLENSFGSMVYGSISSKDFVTAGAMKGDLIGTVERLPLPSIQQPGLLVPPPKAKKKVDCAAAVDDGGQSRTINQVMASLVVTMVDKLYKGELEWMGLYVDLQAGTMTHVPATPEQVSIVTGIPPQKLVRTK